ncbi:hypothetical protein AX769_10300 [Frondihabitans sp. PAMC 28766]|nr:hypothetical protein AX769_10300 [Frondihabitans sp. PAMC 28766]
MAPISFSSSSRKHGVPEEDQEFAIGNPAVVELIESEVLLIIGHPHGQTERWIELPIRALPSGDKNVFHAMELGPRFRPFLEEATRR